MTVGLVQPITVVITLASLYWWEDKDNLGDEVDSGIGIWSGGRSALGHLMSVIS
jgi:hypothetical protein